ncbi:hypothetical protein TCSYLVIO_002323 [Trypanosoma cruzi]|nr:hypothetical protein TCSYLVIO_002323 [Trypanosoma cruzi]
MTDRNSPTRSRYNQSNACLYICIYMHKQTHTQKRPTTKCHQTEGQKQRRPTSPPISLTSVLSSIAFTQKERDTQIHAPNVGRKKNRDFVNLIALEARVALIPPSDGPTDAVLAVPPPVSPRGLHDNVHGTSPRLRTATVKSPATASPQHHRRPLATQTRSATHPSTSSHSPTPAHRGVFQLIFYSQTTMAIRGFEPPPEAAGVGILHKCDGPAAPPSSACSTTTHSDAGGQFQWGVIQQ